MLMGLWYWYRTDMVLLFMYCHGWAFKFSVPGRGWLAIVLLFQGFIAATCLLFISTFIKIKKPPVFKPWFIGRCHAYMRGECIEKILNRSCHTNVFG